MLRFLSYEQVDQYPNLFGSMFEDRAIQFKDRLNWPVTITENGWETDQYDNPNAVYAIWEMPNGTHGASMRMMPTNAPVMINEIFADVVGSKISDAKIWESTRFCISPKSTDNQKFLSTMIMLAGAEFGLQNNLNSAVAIFDIRVFAIYRSIGWKPEILNMGSCPSGKIWAGKWEFSKQIRDQLCKRVGIDSKLPSLWYAMSQKGAAQIDKIAA